MVLPWDGNERVQGWQSEDCAPFCAPSLSETVEFSETMDIMDNVETAYFTTI